MKVLYAHKGLRLGLYIIGGLFVLGVTFQLGVFTGYHKASFARDWGDHYGKNFGMERPESFKGMMRGGLPMGHGAVGKVLTVTLPTFVIEDNDGTEKTIVVSNTTIVKSSTQNSTSTSITPNTSVVVIGQPNKSGQIEAKLIRIMPAGFGTSTSMQRMMGSSTNSMMKGVMRR